LAAVSAVAVGDEVMPTALVTGGNRGIGRAIVVALARSGFNVAFVDVEENDDTKHTCAQARAEGGLVTFIRGDIAELGQHEAIVQSACEFGGVLHTLVNNAGIAAPVRGDLLDLLPDHFDQVLDVNLRGTFFLTQACARRMIADGPSDVYRSIVTITSVSASMASPDRAAYCCSKAALSMMSKIFAVRLAGEGVACYEVRPGVIDTEMTRGVASKYDAMIANGLAPIARWGQPEDVGRAVAALCTGTFSYMTGQSIHVDGGMHVARL
jgi:NAD(P)-dependent dehydrogenase (short-subunit alcohol dehydrogenase family)